MQRHKVILSIHKVHRAQQPGRVLPEAGGRGPKDMVRQPHTEQGGRRLFTPAAFFFDRGAAMADVVIPPQYRVRMKQRLTVLAYAEERMA